MKYRTIVADPPWPYRWSGDPDARGRVNYPTLGVMEIAALPVADLADPTGAHLYLWATPEFNRRGEASRIVQTWKFDVVGEIIWAKPSFGMGRFPRSQHEVLLVGRRGGLSFRVRDEGSVQTWPRGRHSEKPDSSYDLIERASPGPYIELFARRQRLGWDTWGDEALEHVELLA